MLHKNSKVPQHAGNPRQSWKKKGISHLFYYTFQNMWNCKSLHNITMNQCTQLTMWWYTMIHLTDLVSDFCKFLFYITMTSLYVTWKLSRSIESRAYLQTFIFTNKLTRKLLQEQFPVEIEREINVNMHNQTKNPFQELLGSSCK